MTGAKNTKIKNPTITVDHTELVWPGKYHDDGTRRVVSKVSLPFQVIETINESRATQVADATRSPTLFDVWKGDQAETFEGGWRNKLIWGENLWVMGSLLDKFAGKVDLIYIDPPFATGADFSFVAEVGDGETFLPKAQSAMEEKAYRDTWGKGLGSYVQMMYERLTLLRDLLSPTGLLYLHCDSRVNALLRLCLDEIFGAENLRNEIAWCYRGGGTPQNDFAEKHDTIFRYSKTSSYYFDVDPVRIPYSAASTERLKHQARVFRGDKVYDSYEPNELGKHPEDWWTIQPLMPSEKQERIVPYPTQKPIELLQRIIDSSSPPGGLVLDVFCGSGTTLMAAEGVRVVRDEKGAKSLTFDNPRRRWIGCDLGRWAIHVARKRLLSVPDCKPIEILNLGKYERQYWSGVTFGEDLDADGEIALYEYIAFILKLYEAEPLSGMTHLHGRRGKALVHVGAVESPVTISEASDAIDECVSLKQSELHVLGWEWEMGLAGPNNDYRKGGQLQEVAKEKGIKLLMLQIPREVMEQQAVDKGDISFFELAYLDVKIKRQKKAVTVQLTDFVIPNTELIPDEVRDKITKWSDYIDYWAVDWDFRNDTFMQGWVTYRTRKDRKLELESAAHSYEKPGSYRVVVKVIDIFGNDTSQAYDVKVG